MTKSVMIEIDESTKDIMSELEESIMQSIQKSFSTSIEISINKQASQIHQINETFQEEIENLRDEIASSIRPITRMSRDVEDTLRSVMKLEMQFKDQVEALQTIQNGQLETINKEISNIFNKFEQQNATFFQDGLNQFKDKNSQLLDEFTIKLAVVKEEFMTNSNGILKQINNKLQLLENVTSRLTENEGKFNELLIKLDEQTLQQQQMLSNQSQVLMKDLREEMNSFSENMRNQLSSAIDKLELTQKKVNQQFTQSLGTFEINNLKIVQDSMMKHQELLESKTEILLKSINQEDSFLKLQHRINQMEEKEEINSQLLLTKLAELEKDLAYQRLPFYKKWFKKREDF